MKYVALGDSFTEGVGDDDERYPNGVRGWADRVAEEWSHTDPELEYANLSIRGRLLQPILEEQIEPCLALHPDVVTINAGGNDLLRTSVDIDDLIDQYRDAIALLRERGIRVVIWTLIDPLTVSSVYTLVRGRAAIFNELLRERISEPFDCVTIDMWRMRVYAFWKYWSWDRLHMSPLGHELMAIEVLNALGVEHSLELGDVDPHVQRSQSDIRQANLEWARGFMVPWIGRRILGTSSGDDLSPKYSEYVMAAHMPHGADPVVKDNDSLDAGE